MAKGNQEWGTIIIQSRKNGNTSHSINLTQLKPIAEKIFNAPYMNRSQIREYRDQIFACIDWERPISESINFYWDQEEFAFTMKQNIKVIARRYMEYNESQEKFK